MHLYLDLRAFTMMGVVQVAATVRTDTREGTTEQLRVLSTTIPDWGTDDPDDFARAVFLAAYDLFKERP